MIVWLKRAIDDRDAQLDYLEESNPQAAVEFGDRIEEQVARLHKYPKLGRPGRKKGTRELVILHTYFIVVYRERLSRVEILRLLHGAQKWP